MKWLEWLKKKMKLKFLIVSELRPFSGLIVRIWGCMASDGLPNDRLFFVEAGIIR